MSTVPRLFGMISSQSFLSESLLLQYPLKSCWIWLLACCIASRILQVLSLQTLLPTQENSSSVICIHISIWAVLLLLTTRVHGAGFLFEKIKLINDITLSWFCMHADKCTLTVTYSPCVTVRDKRVKIRIIWKYFCGFYRKIGLFLYLRWQVCGWKCHGH